MKYQLEKLTHEACISFLKQTLHQGVYSCFSARQPIQCHHWLEFQDKYQHDQLPPLHTPLGTVALATKKPKSF